MWCRCGGSGTRSRALVELWSRTSPIMRVPMTIPNLVSFMRAENFLLSQEILQQGKPNVLDHISLNITCIGTTFTSLDRWDMWFHHIQKWQICIEDKSSISIFQNDINNDLEPHFFLLYEVAQNGVVFWTISHLILEYKCILIKYSPIISHLDP